MSTIRAGTIYFTCVFGVGELGVVFFVRGQTISEHISSRDPVSGAVYLVSLMLFAAMPTVFIGFRSRKPTN